jgi:Fe-S-cluster containining protein
MDKLSLLKFCMPCNSKCCKTGKLIGSPIISIEEAKKLNKEEKKRLEKVISPTNQEYYIIREQKNSNRCSFLSKDNTCTIQEKKPMDCLCYPIKAIYESANINFIIDTDCPAHQQLSEKFVIHSKKVALKSLKRFDKETYKHWLDNYVGWVENKTLLSNFLRKL